jgi:hypothetical protein
MRVGISTEGMSRELFALFEGGELPSLAPQPTGPMFKEKRSLGHAASGWVWKPFVNASRTDGVQFSHWARTTEDTRGESLRGDFWSRSHRSCLKSISFLVLTSSWICFGIRMLNTKATFKVCTRGKLHDDENLNISFQMPPGRGHRPMS